MADETGVPKSSLSRWIRGGGLSADAIASLIVWSGIPAEISIHKRVLGPEEGTDVVKTVPTR